MSNRPEMSTPDPLEQLREEAALHAKWEDGSSGWCPEKLTWAADEIERLRAELAWSVGMIEKLRADMLSVRLHYGHESIDAIPGMRGMP